jgi:hypothetical protein
MAADAAAHQYVCVHVLVCLKGLIRKKTIWHLHAGSVYLRASFSVVGFAMTLICCSEFGYVMILYQLQLLCYLMNGEGF